jgi:hypothetical protein
MRLCLRQLYDIVVKFEEFVDDLRVFDTVKDGDDSNVVMNSLKIAGLIAEAFPTLLDCLILPSSKEIVTRR